MKRELTLSWAIVLVGASLSYAESTGTVRGTATYSGPDGKPYALPAAHVALSGAGNFEVDADSGGNYSFISIPAGVYQIAITVPGLTGSGVVTVTPDSTVEPSIEIKAEPTKFAIDVSAATETAITAKNITDDTVSEKRFSAVPNRSERIDGALPLIPGVVRGPDGLINLKGGRSSQGGSLVNGANVTDPVTGNSAIRLPIDVVSTVQVIANPYDPEYGKLTGTVTTAETRSGNYEGVHASIQNLFVRPRKRDDRFVGVESATPRATVTGPLIKDRLAFTQSVEYRFVRTPVNSLPAMERDTKLESFDSFTQLDWMINPKQSATVSLAISPQKLDYFGLNTFTPQASTPNLHQRSEMVSMQHRFVTASENLLVSQLAYKRNDADVLANSDDPYTLFLETTEGGFFNRQHRETSRTEWQETYTLAPQSFLGSHHLKTGFDYAHSAYDGRMTFLPVQIMGAHGYPVEQITFGPPSAYAVNQHESAWFVADKWMLHPRLTFDYGVRFDYDSVTGGFNAAPRGGLAYDLTADGKTVLRAGAGVFYDRVVLNAPAFSRFPSRTVSTPDGSNITYTNTIQGALQNPRSDAWNLEVDRQLLDRLVMRVAYQQRNTTRDFVVTPVTYDSGAMLLLTNSGFNQYREFQVTGRYQLKEHILNASYVHSSAYGDLNDLNKFFGNNPQAVIQENQRAALSFDAPNRFLFWGEFVTPGRVTVAPVIDVHTGFPYSMQNEQREYTGEPNTRRFPSFASVDVQATRKVRLPVIGKAKVGLSIFNLLNHYNARDVQNNIDSDHFDSYYNNVGRTFRGKFVLEF